MCVSIKKDKKELLFQLKRKNIIDDRKFWKTVKPMLSNKFDKTNDKEIAKVLNNFFSVIFFSIWVFFHDHPGIIGEQGKEEGIS